MRQQFKKKIVVIYHGNCADGFGGAWAAWKKFGKRAHYYGASHGERPLDYLKKKNIYLIDFSYPPAVIKKLLANNRRVTALDHHVSTVRSTKMTQDYRYALDHSGCVLAWQYFHPTRPVPRFLKHVEDIDLRIPTRLKDSRAARTLLELHGLSFPTVSRLVRGFENAVRRRDLLRTAYAVIAYQDRVVKKLVNEYAQLVRFAGHTVYAVNAPLLEDFVGQQLIERRGPIGIVWRASPRGIRVSLRSDGKADVSKIAARYGGGGHRQASGFGIPFGTKFPWTVVPEKKRR